MTTNQGNKLTEAVADLTTALGNWVSRERSTIEALRTQISTLNANVARLEADKGRMLEWLDLKDLSENAPRAREEIRSLKALLADTHKLVGRGDGHGSAKATAACNVDRILTRNLHVAEAEDQIKRAVAELENPALEGEDPRTCIDRALDILKQ